MGIVLLEHKRILYGIHATDVAAIGIGLWISRRPGAHALNECNRRWDLQIAEAKHFPFCGPSRINEPLELQCGHYVGETGVTIFIQRCGIIGCHPSGHNNGPHPEGQLFILHVIIDALLFTGLLALPTDEWILSKTIQGV